ncbi:MAG: hypothetical protein WCS35_02760 [Sphaerochaeta sp.]
MQTTGLFGLYGKAYTDRTSSIAAPTLYERAGFETIGVIKFDAKKYLAKDSGHTKYDLRDAQAYWKKQGWDGVGDGPDLVVMKLNEEKIGGREGYLQRVIGQIDKGIRKGDITRRIIDSVRDYDDGRESSEVSGAGERDGRPSSGNQGNNGRGTRHSLPHDGILELISLPEIDRKNLGLNEEQFAQAQQNQSPLYPICIPCLLPVRFVGFFLFHSLQEKPYPLVIHGIVPHHPRGASALLYRQLL